MRSFIPAAAAALLSVGPVLGADYAISVISYDPGSNANPAFLDPASALGPPTRFTGVGVFPSVVSPFNPPFMPSELVSIGTGGSLVLELGRTVADDPAHPFGAELLIFANTFFIDADFPSATVGPLFGGTGTVEVSADGLSWSLVPGADPGLGFPTRGYIDAGPYDVEPGREESDAHAPIDPAFTPDDLFGFHWSALSNFYATSAGGLSVDIADAGLSEVRFVRISVPTDAPGPLAIDAVTIVRPVLTGDLNGDGIVDLNDLLLLLAAWGPCPDGAACPADLDGNGEVNLSDLLQLLAAWS